jgi:fibronectin-binding autotransporter adhesin
MRKLLWLLLLASAMGQTVNTNILPASTGLDLGSSSQRWDGFFRNVNISGTCTGAGCSASGGGGAPTTSKYIIQTADGDLINAQVLANLSTGMLKVTTTTGVLSIAGLSDLPLGTPLSSGLCYVSTGTTAGSWGWGACSGSAATNFSSLVADSANISGGVFTIGNGTTMTVSGTGIINATKIIGTAITALIGNSGKLVQGTGSITSGDVATWDASSNIISSGTQLTALAPKASPTFTGTVTLPATTFGAITGSTQCLHVNTSGVVSGAGSDCSSGSVAISGTPSANQIARWTNATTIEGITTVPITAGGTGTASTLVGLVRGNSSAMTAAELSGVVITSGSNVVTPGKVDVMQTSWYCSDAGASDTYACNLSPAATSYVTGTHYFFQANTANTGAATINFNSLGAKTIKKPSGGSIVTDLADNDIRAGQWVDLIYDGTNMQMASQLGNSPAGSGTVTVVAAGSLTSGAIVTGGSGTTLQTPSGSATLDSSANASFNSVTTTAANGGLDGTEGTGAGLTAATGHDLLYPDSTLHAWKMNNNNGGAVPVVAGPTSATSGHVAMFSGTTGGIIADGTAVAANLITYASPATGIARTTSSSQAIVGTELSGVVITSGSNATTPGKVDVMQTSSYCSDAGANDTYTCSLSPAATAYVTGTTYRFKANTANTGAATVNFNSLGALTIKKPNGGSITTDLADNDIRAGQWVNCVYDGTNCQMTSQVGNAPSGSGTVNSGTSGQLAYYASSTTAVSAMGADFTFNTHTLSGGASAILDMHSAATSGVLLPGGLSTGLVKVTTSTGAISTATASDIPHGNSHGHYQFSNFGQFYGTSGFLLQPARHGGDG